MPDDNLSRIEREVQRRVTDALASAGVSRGRLSHEVLYMLPPQFTRAYVKLFDQSLAETVRTANVSDLTGRRGVKRTGALRDSGKGARERRAVVQVGPGGGKRYVRRHWWVRDEVALKVKESLDRKLIRMGQGIERELAERKRAVESGRDTLMINGGLSIEEVEGSMNEEDEVTYRCIGCGMDHTPLVRLWGRMQEAGLLDEGEGTVRHCPRCGLFQG